MTEIRVTADVDTKTPVIVTVSEWKGETRLDARKYYADKGTGELRPTKKGVNVPVDDALAVAQAILDAYNMYTDQDLVIVPQVEVDGG